VKECFVLSDKAKSLANLDPPKFELELGSLIAQVKKLNDIDLDAFLASRSRAGHFDRYSWTLGEISTEEAGVWFTAGGLPDSVCFGSVWETAVLIRNMGGPECLPTPYQDHRAKDNLSGIIRMASIFPRERLLSIIAEPGGTHRNPPCKRMRWDLCDGSLRALGQALAGVKNVNAFIRV